jgi:hypothetical protein
MAYGTINADVIQSSVTGVSLGAGNATVFKNRLINGDMRIDQRNAGASVTPTVSSYTLDRWGVAVTAASKFSVQQNAGAVTPPAGYINYLGVTSLSAYSIAAGDIFAVYQAIEGLNVADLTWGTANAKTVTLSFQVYSSLTGTFGGSLRNSATNRSYPFTYTVSTANTWTSISITVAGDTSGTWLTTNGVGIYVTLSLGSGATFSGTAGAWAAGNYTSATGATSVVGTSGATFYVTGVQLEVGSSATGFEYVDYGRELQMCQRYYVKWAFPTNTGGGAGMGTAVSSTLADIQLIMPVALRTSATASLTIDTNSLQVYVVALAVPYSGGTWAIGYLTNPQVIAVRYQHGSGVFTAGQVTYPAATTGTNPYLAIGAEL